MVDVSVPLQELFGTNSKLDSVRTVSGGDINDAYLLIQSDGKRIFLKENTQRNARFFKAEQVGLAAIKNNWDNFCAQSAEDRNLRRTFVSDDGVSGGCIKAV